MAKEGRLPAVPRMPAFNPNILHAERNRHRILTTQGPNSLPLATTSEDVLILGFNSMSFNMDKDINKEAIIRKIIQQQSFNTDCHWAFISCCKNFCSSS